MRQVTWTTCVCLGLAALACAAPPAPGRAQGVVLVILDTVRADHLSVYGYARDTTPNLARRAQNGAVFDHAFAAASWTLPSVTSILTGRLPSDHGAGSTDRPEPRRRYSRIRRDVATLAERMQQQQFASGGVANAGFMSPRFGLGRGFDIYDWVASTDEEIRRAGPTVDRALEWIAAQPAEQPFFLLLHAFDAHRFFDAPAPFRGRYTNQFADAYGDTLDSLESRRLAEQRGDLDFHVAAYDEEIAYLDAELERFLSSLERTGRLGDTLVIVTSDHGESLHDHGERGHGGSLYNEIIRVPLLMWGPGIRAGRYDEVVSLLDIVPTALDWVGAPPDTSLPGLSLRMLLNDAAALPERVVMAELDNDGKQMRVGIRWPYKLLFDPRGGGEMVFDLANDPGESRNLIASGSVDDRQLLAGLRRLVQAERRRQRGDDVELDPAALDELRALGYIQ